MLSYDNCPNNLPCMPEYPTINGMPMSVPAMFGEWRNHIPETRSDSYCESYEESYNKSGLNRFAPVLVSIGLSDALREIEAVLAWNQTEKHPNAKWKSKSINWHDSKAVSHLSKAQNESLKDNETQRSHRAHACCRLLMSLAHELNQNNS